MNDYLYIDYLEHGTTGPSTITDPSRKLIVKPHQYYINDNIVRPSMQLLELSAALSGVNDAYQITSIDVANPTGYITLTSGEIVTTSGEIKEPALSDTTDICRIANILVSGEQIDRIMLPQSSREFIQPIIGVAQIPDGSSYYDVIHNLGHDYIAYAIPLEEPEDNATYNHFISYSKNGGVTRFSYRNWNGVTLQSLWFLYIIIPTYGLHTTMTLDEVASGTPYLHGGCANTATLSVIEGLDPTNATTEVGEFYISKAYMKDDISISGTGGTNFSIKSAVVPRDIIAAQNTVSVSNRNDANIPGIYYFTKWTGVLTNFLYNTDAIYWLNMDTGGQVTEIRYKGWVSTGGGTGLQPAGASLDTIILQ
jgi:hypothetical protein